MSPSPYRAKTLAEEIQTIKTFGFGIENYKVVNNTHVRIKGK